MKHYLTRAVTFISVALFGILIGASFASGQILGAPGAGGGSGPGFSSSGSGFSTTGTPTTIFSPFGGRVLSFIPCDEGFLLTVGPPVSGQYMFIYGASRLYAYFAPHPQAWVLGLATPIQTSCTISGETVGQGKFITMLGTSL